MTTMPISDSLKKLHQTNLRTSIFFLSLYSELLKASQPKASIPVSLLSVHSFAPFTSIFKLQPFKKYFFQTYKIWLLNDGNHQSPLPPKYFLTVPELSLSQCRWILVSHELKVTIRMILHSNVNAAPILFSRRAFFSKNTSAAWAWKRHSLHFSEENKTRKYIYDLVRLH